VGLLVAVTVMPAAADSGPVAAATGVESNATGSDGRPGWRSDEFTLFGRLGAVILRREGNESKAIIQDTNTGATVLRASSFDLDWQPGMEAVLGAGIGPFGVEARWFEVGQVGTWSDGTATTTPAIWNFPTNPPLFGLGVAQIDGRLTSELYSVELNFRWQALPHLAFLVGPRYFMVSDDLNLRASFAQANTADIGVETRNRLVGGQVGVEGRVPILDRLEMRGVAKLGYLHNSAKSRFSVAQQVGPGFGAKGDSGPESWMGEGVLDVVVRLTPWLALTAGYQVLWLEEVAKAVTQFQMVDVLAGAASPASRDLVLHGFRMGLEFRY
jgi:hypothetical protein